MFVRSSSPLRTEADNWFLSELRGRYDVVLKYIARKPGCSHGELLDHVKSVSSETSEQVGGYLKVLIDRYRMVEKRLPVQAKPTARRNRYYLRDNFLRAWLSSLANPLSAVQFRPEETVLQQADERLMEADGHVARFINDQPRFCSWKLEKVAIAPSLSASARASIERRGYIPQDLRSLTEGL